MNVNEHRVLNNIHTTHSHRLSIEVKISTVKTNFASFENLPLKRIVGDQINTTNLTFVCYLHSKYEHYQIIKFMWGISIKIPRHYLSFIFESFLCLFE